MGQEHVQREDSCKAAQHAGPFLVTTEVVMENVPWDRYAYILSWEAVAKPWLRVPIAVSQRTAVWLPGSGRMAHNRL